MDAVVGQFLHLFARVWEDAVEGIFSDRILNIFNRSFLGLALMEAARVERACIMIDPAGGTKGACKGVFFTVRHRELAVLFWRN
jgi:hypothetical protein